MTLISLSDPANAVCCFTPSDQCTEATSQTAKDNCISSGGILKESTCNNYADCENVCCCDLPSHKYTTKMECNNNGYASSIKTFNKINGLSNEQSCIQACSGVTINLATYTSCNGENPSGRLCGSTLTTSTSKWCCAAGDGSIFSTQNLCQTQSSCNSGESYSISGIIQDSVKGTPLSGVHLETKGQTAESFADGTFTISNVPAGDGQIKATRLGYKDEYKNYSLNTNTDISGFLIVMINLSSQLQETCADLNADTDHDGCLAQYDNSCSAFASFLDEKETNLCSDGIDNDCDGSSDCNDLECQNVDYCTSGQGRSYCGDSIVNKPNFFGVWEQCESNADCQTGSNCVNCQCTKPSTTTCGDAVINGSEECDTRANPSFAGWLCTSNEICSQISCTCVEKVLSCGNNQLDSDMGEECDFNGNGGVLSGSVCSIDQCIQPGNPGACLCQTTNKCGNMQIDAGEDCDIGTNSCPADKTCNLGTCHCNTCDDNSKKPTLYNTTTPAKITLNWNSRCTSGITKYEVLRCDASAGDCNPTTVVSTKASSITQYEETITSTPYCYKLKAYYGEDSFISEQKICTSITKYECSNDPRDYYCSNNMVTSCENGKNTTIDNCNTKSANPGEDYTCVDFPYDGNSNAMCVYQSQCGFCNGYFQMFSSEDTRKVQGVNALTKAYGTSVLCKNLMTCYLDNTKTSVDKYYECKNVGTCYDYKSDYACEQNRCSMGGAGSCEWTPSPKYGEFGIGVCRPRDETIQDCRQCNNEKGTAYEPLMNGFYGYCDEDLCKLYSNDSTTGKSNCFYVDPKEGVYQEALGCINKRDMACAFYGNNKDDCIGAGNDAQESEMNNHWATNPVYGQPLNPDSGDNSLIHRSKDTLNFGLCRWHDDGADSFCYKDGNGDKLSIECDGDTICNRDNTPPTTEITYLPPLKEDLIIPFTISDNESIEQDQFLHFKIVEKGQSCYPDGKNPSENVIKTKISEKIRYSMLGHGFERKNSKDYTLCYFGEDAHSNFEIVKTQEIEVDTATPEVKYTLANISYEVQTVDDYAWVTNLTINVSLEQDEKAYCNIFLAGMNQGPFVGGLNIQKKQMFPQTWIILNYKALIDDTYYLGVNCTDVAGNTNSESNKYLLFTLDADKKITNLLPSQTYGPNDEVSGEIPLTLSADTDEDAKCRLSQETANYSMMNELLVGESTTHTYSRTYPSDFEGDGVKKYNVRCEFENGKIRGNYADTIMFAIDYQSPQTIFTNQFGDELLFDNTLWYQRSQLENIFMNCEDIPMYYNNNPAGKDWAAGCKEVQFGFGETSESIKPTGQNSTLISDDIPLGNGIFNLWYKSTDNKGNSGDISNKKIKIDDDTDYSFEFTLYNKNWEPVDTITWEKEYYVKIESTKETPNYDSSPGSYYIKLNDLSASINGKNYLLNFTKDTTDSKKHIWYATLKLKSSSDLAGFNGEDAGKFIIEAEDSHKGLDGHGIISKSIIKGETFKIDTTPPSPPELYPAFEDDITANYEYYYPENFNAHNWTYYTNTKNLFITGATSEKGRIFFYLNNMANNFESYDQSQNSEETPLSSFYTIDNTYKGENTLLFQYDLTDYFKEENYLLVEEYPRENYGHFRKFYKIMSSNTLNSGEGPTSTLVTVSPSFEKDVLQNSKISVFTSEYPSDWFGVAPSLTIGENMFSAKIKDDVGNYAQTPIYKIYYDNSTPSIVSSMPIHGSILGDTDVDMKITINDFGSGLDTEKISLKINDEKVDSNITETLRSSYIIDGKNISFIEYEITYSKESGFEKGVYDIQFNAEDLAKNKIEKNWTFEIDDAAPSDPEFEMIGLDKNENYVETTQTWFTNQVRSFKLTFFDNANVTIQKINLYEISYDGIGGFDLHFLKEDSASCQRIESLNIFECTFNNESLVSKDNDYAIKVVAKKILDTETREGEWYKLFSMDTKAPVYSLEYRNITNSNAVITFMAYVEPGEKQLKASIKIDDGDILSLVPEEGDQVDNTLYLFQKPYGFTWDVPERESEEYAFTFYLEDFAGNKESSTHTIIIDNMMPMLNIKNITSTPLVIEEMSPYNLSDDEAFSNDESEEKAKKKLKLIPKENVRIGAEEGADGQETIMGNSISLQGTISSDTENIIILKMKDDGTLFDETEAPLELSTCLTRTPNNCFIDGAFHINDLRISGLPGEETPNYLLFKVIDKADNTAYYTLVLLSDLASPKAPEIEIIS